MSWRLEPIPTLTGLGAERLRTSSERIVVVGGGGWIGRATLEALHSLLGRAFHDRVVAFGSDDRALHLRRELIVMQRPLATLATLEPRPSLVLHLAFLTQEKAQRMGEADYVDANAAISRTVLDALDPIGAAGVFVASSGAVHLVDRPEAEPSKRLYGALKLRDEADFAAWGERRGAKTVVGRIFNVAGPYLRTGGGYALAAFIDDALSGRPIAIKARRPVFRSYVSISELMSVVIGALLAEDPSSVRFETAGDEVLEMAAVAETVRRELAPKSLVTRAPLDSDVVDRYVGDGVAYRALRHRFQVRTVDFPAQVRQTAAFMASAVLAC